MQQIYDLVIIGGGIAGMTAAICAAENGQDVMILDKQGVAGGNLPDLEDARTWPGFPSISGADLKTMFREHLDVLHVPVFEGRVTEIDASGTMKSVWCGKKEYISTGIVIAAGEPSGDRLSSQLSYTENGTIPTDSGGRTALPCVYAAGNAREGCVGTILSASADGENVIISFLSDITP